MNTTIELNLHHTVSTSVTPTQRVCEVAAMFGLGVDERKTIQVIPPTRVTLGPGRLVFITGASGGGKTTLLRTVRQEIEPRNNVRVIDFDDCGLHMTDRDAEPSLVDALGDTLEDAARYLSLAGLNDAHVMLRKPSELSDGQRYRWRLACAMHAADRCDADCLPVVLADEFGATLDRMTAAIIAGNVRKWTRRSGVCVLAATTHDDLLESLQPDVLIVQHPGEGIEVMEKSG
ncbi:ATP-binding cassette domain-containing protein [Planctomycetales bacterium ZRK34]|nr:ATP-binding cassette domain-containing protein [Planctomycetales bacterium ZRK34]